MAKTGKGRKCADNLFMVDYAAFICVFGSTMTGVLLWLFIGKGAEEQKFLLGWHRHEWGDLHLLFSLMFLVMMAVHFVQHWRWIKTVTQTQIERKNLGKNVLSICGVTLLTLACVFALFGLFRSGTEPYGRGGYGHRRNVKMESVSNVEEGGTGTRISQAIQAAYVSPRRVACSFQVE